MTQQDEAGRGAGPATENETPRDDKTRRRKVGDGLKQGLGFLSAFKDALEETIQEARERGDLSTDRAKEVMKEALDKAQAAGERARERLDFAHQTELEGLREAVESLRERVRALEASAFGAATDAAPEPGPAEADESPAA